MTAADSNGSWYYSTDNGGNWNLLGVVSDASARLLAADGATRLYFRPNADFNGSIASALTIRAWDQTSGSNGSLADTSTNGGMTAFSSTSDSVSLTVIAVNDAPVLTVSSGPYLYTEGAGAVLLDAAASVSDIDSANFSGGTLQFDFSANGQAEDILSIRNQGVGAGQIGVSGAKVTYGGVTIGTYSGGTSGTDPLIISFNGNATPTPVQALARNITYQNTSDNPLTLVRTLEATLSEGDGGTSAPVGGNLVISAVNDAPVNNAPGPQNVNEDSSLVFSAANGNLISITDVDANTGSLTVSLSVTSGTLTLIGTAGLSFITGDGTADASLQFSGTLASINAALEAMTYTAAPGFNGAANLSITTDDNGNTGSGGYLSDNDGVSLNVVAVNDPPVITSDGGGASASVTIAESSTAITTVTTSDVDSGVPTYTIAGGNDAALFTIDNSTGALWFVTGRDRENPTDFNADNIYDVVVQVDDGAAGTDSQSINVTISDVDEFDVGPIGDGNRTVDSVNENAGVGGLVGITAQATDGDATNSAITYTLDDDAGGRFAISGLSGVVTVADGTLLDYEAATSHAITVRVTSTDGSFSTQVFTISLNPVNDDNPVITSDGGGPAAAITVAENSTTVTTVTATDADLPAQTLNFNLVGGADMALFTIDGSTGAMSFVSGRDLETPTDADLDGVYVVNVQVADGAGGTDTQTISVSLTDVDEFDVGSIGDSDVAINVANENAASGALVGLTAQASDPDATNNAMTYALDDDAGGRFAIDATTGVVTVADGTLLDRESAASHDITVRATSGDGSTITQIFTINIGDIDEFDIGPVTDTDAASNAIDENAANGTVVGITALASDVDATMNAISYSLDDSAGGRFAIDAVYGVVTVVNGSLLDYEVASSHTITVRATSTDGSFSTQDFTIDLNPLNDIDPVITSDGSGAAAAISIAENASTVTVVAASDSDLPLQNMIYSIVVGADAARFTIDATTGALALITAPDFESPTDSGADNVYDVNIQASDGAGRIDTQDIAVIVTGVNEGPVAQGDDFTVDNTDELAVAGPGLLANDIDPEGDPLTAVLVTGPQHGTLTLNADGSFTYTPNPNFAGTDTFVYQADDGSARSAPIIVQVTVSNTGGPLPPSDSGGGSSGGGDSTTDDSDSDSEDSDDGGSGPTVGDNPFRPTHNQGSRKRRSDDSAQEVMQPAEPPQRAASAESAATEPTQVLASLAKGVRRVVTAGERQVSQAVGDVVDADTQTLSLALVQIRNQVESSSKYGGYIAGSVAIASAATSAGYALWLLRGAQFATTFLARIPAWRRFDPLPLLSSASERRRDEGESLSEIATGQGLPTNSAAAQEAAS